jgi:hypothetical protein
MEIGPGKLGRIGTNIKINMSSPSIFESRHGKVSCTAREVFEFVTDIRNFEQFIPVNSISNWNAARESCSFKVSMLGEVAVRISEKTEYTKVVYNGDALKKEDFTLTLNIYDNMKDSADISIILVADLNPMMKMMAVKPINQFLELLVSEMEKFRGWKDVKL